MFRTGISMPRVCHEQGAGHQTSAVLEEGWNHVIQVTFRCHIDAPQCAEEEGYRFPAKAAGSASLEPRFFLPAPPKVFGPTQWRTYAEMGKLCKACTWSVA